MSSSATVDPEAWSASRSSSSAGPLTTVFTPPPDCSAVHAITSVLTSSNTANLGGWWRPGAVAYMPSPAWASGWLDPNPEATSVSNTCYPSGTAVRQRSAFYSPGVHCPNGWTSAMTVSSSQIRLESNALFTPTNYAQSTQASSFIQSLLPEETMVLCCPANPPNFKINTADFLCRGYLAGTPTATLYGYGAGVTSAVDGSVTNRVYGVDPTLHTIPLVPKDASSSFTVSIPFQTTAHAGSGPVSATISAYPVQIRWREEDEVKYLWSNGSSKETGAGSKSTETAAATEAKGLPSGGIAGVVVGVIAGIALVALAAFLILRSRRRRRADMESAKPLPAPPEYSKGGAEVNVPELSSPEKGVILMADKGPGPEIKHLHEAPTGPDRMELDGTQRFPGVYELGDGAPHQEIRR